MDWSFVAAHVPDFLGGAWVTLRFGLYGVACSAVLGLICSLVRVFRVPVLRGLIRVYVELSRNTPLLVQLFFLYAGLPRVGITLSAEACAVVGLTFLGGGYMAEAFRSGLEAVDRTQREAGECIGLTALQTVRWVVLPQALATAAPALFANMIFLIKETSMFSVLAMMDLMNVADTLRTSGGRTIEVLSMLVIAYVVILLPVSVLATLVERRMRFAGFGNQHTV
ncbi:MAG: amino acid ABC transporter permease [Clostridiales bacterium]|nr:amino acid ABC transporter permease [Clostridiales bacterium]